MNLRHTLALLASAAAIAASAAPISPEKALEIVNGPSSRKVLRSLGGSSSFKIAAKRLTPAGDATACYLMTRGGMPGYVIVAGDDALGTEILGYTDNGTLAEMPDNMRAWLDQAGRAVDYLNAHPGAAVKKVAVPSRSAAVGPLLGDIHWGQQPYYNRKAPSTSYPIGCVATAVGQVMYSHRWPERGTGSHSYTSTTHKLEISQDFSQSTYLWDKMANTLDNTSSTETVDAVASMLYDFAVSVEMDFQVGGSGAYSEKIAGALANHFGYSKQAHCAKRDAYTGEQWLEMLHGELDNGFSVVYGGATSGMGMGHSFVCDGYNEDGLYHINWGWNGNGNGYFALNALAYDYIDMSTGQSMKDGFNYHQDMIVGMRPDRDGSTQWRDYEFFTEGLMAVGADGDPVDFHPVTIACGGELPIYLYEAYNISNRMTPVREMGLRMTDAHGGQVAAFSPVAAGNFRFGPVLDDPVVVTLPAQLPDGEYIIEPYFLLDGESQPRKFTTSVGAVSRLKAVVADGQAEITPAGHYSLRVEDLTWTPDHLDSDVSSTFRLTVTNDGELYDGCLYFQLKVKGDNVAHHWYNSPHVDVTIPAGETRTIEFTQELDCYRSDAYVITFYNRDEKPFYSQEGLSIDGREPEPELSLTKKIKFIPKDYQVPWNCMILEAELINEGGLYEGKMFWVMVDPYTMMTNDNYEGRDHEVVIPGNGTVKTVHVMGVFDYPNSWSMSNEFLAVFNHVGTNCMQAGSIGPQKFNLLETTYGSKNEAVTWDPAWDTQNADRGQQSGVECVPSVAPKADIAISCVDGVVVAKLPAGAALKALTVFDAQGRPVAFGPDGAEGEVRVDISALPSAPYFVAVSTTAGSAAAPVVR